MQMRKVSRDEWLRDIDARQRNVIFPDTAQNEARFWRNIISGKRHLTTAQITGIAIMWLAMAFPLWELLKWMSYSIYAWLTLSLLGTGFLLLRWRTLRTLSSVERHRR
jgi:hypothetical protein